MQTFTFAVPDDVDADDARLMIVPGTEAQLDQWGADLMAILAFAQGQAVALATLHQGFAAQGVATADMTAALAALATDAAQAARIMDRICVVVGRGRRVEADATAKDFTKGGIH